MKKPYLRKLSTAYGFNTWEVDGKYVREHWNEDFTNFGQHYAYTFIPTREFWIDQEHAPGEEDFFIHHMQVEWKLMRRGVLYDRALAYGDRAERAERKKSLPLKRAQNLQSNAKRIAAVHKRLLAEYANGLRVWLVRGELVRDLYFIDYTEGGHDKVYAFVPEKEVWLDDDLSPRERRFVLLHEVHERRCMAGGWSYAKAHRSATEIEYRARKRPALFASLLRKEMKLNAV